MRILFAGGNGYTPEFSGGVQSSTDHLVRQCIAAGHEAGVLAALFGSGLFGLRARVKMKLAGRKAARDAQPGYPVVRAWFPAEEAAFAVREIRPDVAVVQCQKSVPIGLALQREGVPLVVYFRNVEFAELEGDPRDLDALFVANSRFTAERYREVFGLDCTVIPPTIDPAKYRADGSRDRVTFINVYPEKGFERAVELARSCPDIPFLFLEGWLLDDARLAEVERELATLPNVAFERRTNDMRAVYARTRILLAPSRWEEAWGRVASEAHCSGIPVLGSTRGGLPEAIGPGGVALDHDAPLEDWTAALRAMWDDEERYALLSRAAAEWSARPELDPARQFETFMDVLERAASGGAKGVTPLPLSAA